MKKQANNNRISKTKTRLMVITIVQQLFPLQLTNNRQTTNDEQKVPSEIESQENLHIILQEFLRI